jgi:hypothetical protein
VVAAAPVCAANPSAERRTSSSACYYERRKARLVQSPGCALPFSKRRLISLGCRWRMAQGQKKHFRALIHFHDELFNEASKQYLQPVEQSPTYLTHRYLRRLEAPYRYVCCPIHTHQDVWTYHISVSLSVIPYHPHRERPLGTYFRPFHANL